MTAYNHNQAMAHIEQLQEVGYKLFCPDCLGGLETAKEGLLYCPNEMCLNERHYNKDGSEVQEE